MCTIIDAAWVNFFSFCCENPIFDSPCVYVTESACSQEQLFIKLRLIHHNATNIKCSVGTKDIIVVIVYETSL